MRHIATEKSFVSDINHENHKSPTRFVFQVALGRRLSAASKPAVKSAFYVTSPGTTHYAKLHAVLTDYSPLDVALFTDRGAAAKWLGVPLKALSE
ncbi:MAG: hypothetical protein WAN04_10690 [Candidatus Udaeobacter sp.]